MNSLTFLNRLCDDRFLDRNRPVFLHGQLRVRTARGRDVHKPVGLDGQDAEVGAFDSRWQLSRILSNTGRVSSTELLMTSSTSAMAVWRSSASLVSLKRRAFSMAITAWSAKVVTMSIWRVV